MQHKITFIQLFDNHNQIIIPSFQRDYAQGRADSKATQIRERFVDALYRAVTKHPITLDFIYGNTEKDSVVTLLDGQQRLTTLFLLHWYAAKKANLPPTEYDFLKRFSYSTRPSSRHFCEKLVECQPDFIAYSNLSDSIKDQNWFPLGWQKDPTIHAMLTMIDAIDAKFRGVDDLWGKLASGCITFYFLQIKDLGLTDELYIRMNSRGKPLSEFEILKAKLESEIEKISPDKAREVATKIDGKWTDFLWHYKSDGHLVDDAFLRCFRFICQVICFRARETLHDKPKDTSWLLDRYFHPRSDDQRPIVESNIETLISFFDTWSNIASGHPLRGFFERFVTFVSDGGKAKISKQAYHGNLDLFGELANSSAEYALPKFSLFYAFTVYAQHLDNITEPAFRRRIRIVNNLIQNSTDEINDDEKRAGGNRMPAILRQIDSIILHGKVTPYNRDDPESRPSFNANQLKEEFDKLYETTVHPGISDALFTLEDHDLLYGQIGIIGVDRVERLSARFIELFRCSRDNICRALMATGDYSQKEKSYQNQFQIGSGSSIPLPWRTLFHHGANEGYENTSKVLVQLLESHEHFSDEVLDEIAAEYLATHERDGLYDWRYYYIKYDAFRPTSFNNDKNPYYGKYYLVNNHQSLIITTKNRCSEYAYSPFLKAVQEQVGAEYALEDYENRRNLLTNGKLGYRFEEHRIHINDGDLQYGIPINYNFDSIDTEDRIQKLVDLITNPQPE